MININRTAYLLTTNKTSPRTLFSQNVLNNIGFTVVLVQCIPNNDKVLSNKISMQSIYKMIMNNNIDPLDQEYAYVFEDDINILEEISLSEIIEYEKISPIFFYLGVCRPIDAINLYTENKIKINNHKVITISGNVRGLHAIGISKKGAELLYNYSNIKTERYMDVILEEFTLLYPANVVRYDLESYIAGHRGIFFQDRDKFPTSI